MIAVKETKNYSMFKSINGNRSKNELHLSRLKKSMEEHQLVSPIIVNEKYEVIDGQHRLAVCTDLKLPVYYIVVDGYGLDEVHRLNQNTSNWSHKAFIDGYASMGLEPYIQIQEFMDETKLGVGATLYLLAGYTGQSQTDKLKRGEIKEVNLKRGYEIYGWILQIEQAVPKINVRRRGMMSTFIHLHNNTNFNIDHFVSKLILRQGFWYDCSNAKQYLDLVEEIYNYKNRNKISLRY
jgi:hypothetical protein